MSGLFYSSLSRTQNLARAAGEQVQEILRRQEKYIILQNPVLNIGFLGLGCVWAINRLLTKAAEDNWLLRSSVDEWQWENEVAVITGGSNGIGALITEGLAAKGVTVAVIDIAPLAEDADKSKFP